MSILRRLSFVFAANLACGQDIATNESATGESTTTATTALPTTDTTTDAPPGPTTGTTTDATVTTHEASTTGTDTTGTTTGTDTTGTTTLDTTTGTTTTGTTTGNDGVCLAPTDSDTAADPAAWSVTHTVPQDYLIAEQLAVGLSGSVVYSTTFRGELDLGGGPLDSDGGYHRFFASHAADGGFQWSSHIGGDYTNIEHFWPAIDCAGNLVIAGSFWRTIAVEDQMLTAVFGEEAVNDLIFETTDMFLAHYGPGGELHWAKSFGDATWQRIHDLTVQPDGTIVIAGATQGTLDLGAEPIVSNGAYHGVLAAFDHVGALVWQRDFATTLDVAVLGVDAGPDGRLSTYGHAGDDVDFGGGIVPHGGDATFVAQFEADGAHRWSRRFFDEKHEPRFIGADTAGGVVLGGDYYPGGTSTGFIARFDDASELAWSRDFTPALLFEIDALAVGDGIAITGNMPGTFDFGGGPVVAGDRFNMYVARYDLAGVNLTSEVFTGLHNPRTAEWGPDGELVFGGSFSDGLDLGAGPLAGDNSLFVHRFSP